MIDQKVLEQIEQLGKLQFSIEEVCVICDITEKQFDKEAKRSYLRGMLRAQAEVREKNYEHARQGVPSSQRIFFDHVENLKRQNEDSDSI